MKLRSLALIVALFSGLSATASAQGYSCIHDGSDTDILRLSFHATGITGLQSNDDFEHAAHHHDPAEEIDLQAFELNLFSNLSSYVQLNSTYNISEDRGKLTGELEEGFLKLHRLPYGFEAKAGRFIHKLGVQGNLHIHDWQFATSDLTTSLLLGEEGVLTDGAELSWHHIYELGETHGVLGLTLAHGEVTEESEDEAGFTNDVTSLRATIHSFITTQHQHFLGLTFAQGDNGFGRDTNVLGFDYTYSWTDAKAEGWAPSVDTSIQITQREIEWQDGGTRGSDDQLAASISSLYHFKENWNAGVRAEWIEDIDNGTTLDESERLRLSTAVTRSLQLFTQNDAQLRLQYNYDETSNSQAEEDNHSLWLQMTFSFGKGWSADN